MPTEALAWNRLVTLYFVFFYWKIRMFWRTMERQQQIINPHLVSECDKYSVIKLLNSTSQWLSLQCIKKYSVTLLVRQQVWCNVVLLSFGALSSPECVFLLLSQRRSLQRHWRQSGRIKRATDMMCVCVRSRWGGGYRGGFPPDWRAWKGQRHVCNRDNVLCS